MLATLINGREIAKKIRDQLKIQIAGIQLKLGILCSDISPASISYQETLIKIAHSIGIEVELARFTIGTTQENLEAKITEWNRDQNIHGIFILQPLFEGIDVDELRAMINPLKDTECVHPFDSSLRHLSADHIGSCTAMAVIEILDSLGVKYGGAEVVVVGNSKVVGRPVTKMLVDRNTTVTICNKETSDRDKLRAHVERAEILVVAIGQPEHIKGHWIKEGAIVIDVGFNKLSDGKIVGDVEFDMAIHKASYITQAIGGVGPVTAIIGMRQLFIAYTLQQKQKV